MYLDYAESQAARQIPMSMADWVEKLDAFIKFNEYDVLKNAARFHTRLPKNWPSSITNHSGLFKTAALKAILSVRRDECLDKKVPAAKKTKTSGH